MHDFLLDNNIPSDRFGEHSRVDLPPPQRQRRKELGEVAEDFEALIATFLVRSMRQAMAPNGFYEKGYGGEIFQSMMDEVLAQKLAERKNLGIAEALIRQFAQFLPEADSANNAEDRPSNFALLIDAAAQRHAVDAALLRAVIEQESAGNPRAVSPKGAAGLMQLMPETAERLGVDDRFDAGQNIDGGARYLAELLRRFGTVEAALAAYNAGPEAVERYGGVPPYPETQEYVKRVIAKYRALTATSNESEAVKNNSVKLKTEAWQLLNVPRGLKDHTE